MELSQNDNKLLEMFGLTYEQSILLFSTERIVTKYDIKNTKSEKLKDRKKEWLSDLEKRIKSYLNELNESKIQS